MRIYFCSRLWEHDALKLWLLLCFILPRCSLLQHDWLPLTKAYFLRAENAFFGVMMPRIGLDAILRNAGVKMIWLSLVAEFHVWSEVLKMRRILPAAMPNLWPYHEMFRFKTYSFSNPPAKLVTVM